MEQRVPLDVVSLILLHVEPKYLSSVCLGILGSFGVYRKLSWYVYAKKHCGTFRSIFRERRPAVFTQRWFPLILRHYRSHSKRMLKCTLHGFEDIALQMLKKRTSPGNSLITVFLTACESGCLKLIKAILEAHFDYITDMIKDKLYLPFQKACDNNQKDVAEYFMDAHDGIFCPTECVWRVFMNAVDMGYLDIVKLMCQRGSVESDDAVIWFAKKRGHQQIIEFFIEQREKKRVKLYTTRLLSSNKK